MSIHLRRGLLILCIGVGVGACDPFGLDAGGDDELERNRTRWTSLGLSSYEYVVSRSCFCAPSALGPVLEIGRAHV